MNQHRHNLQKYYKKVHRCIGCGEPYGDDRSTKPHYCPKCQNQINGKDWRWDLNEPLEEKYDK